MDAISYLREDVTWAHELLELVMQDATQEQADWAPPGRANPLGATYAHALTSEDMIVNRWLQGAAPLMESAWKGRTGISEPQFGSDFEWARRVRVQLPAAQAYAQAVYTATDHYLASLEPAALDRVLDLSKQGFGPKTAAWVLSALVISHMNNMTGESAVLKGIQGAKGYPW
ncbi:MAG: DinB family protein [Anaerolineales bacterium]